jgi:hypothetical protein
LLFRRVDESLEFYDRSWRQYKEGFNNGLTNGNLWLGNDRIHVLSRLNNDNTDVVLRIEIFGDNIPNSAYRNIYLYGDYFFSVSRLILNRMMMNSSKYAMFIHIWKRLFNDYLIICRYRTNRPIIHFAFRNRSPATRVTTRLMATMSSMRIMQCHFRQAIAKQTITAVHALSVHRNSGSGLLYTSMRGESLTEMVVLAKI